VTAPLFLLDAPGRLDGDVVVLDGPEGRHAATVRRIGVGERVDVTDGAGLRVRTTVRATRPDSLELEVLGRETEPPPSPRLVVVQALAKGDRGELAVQLMTETGVDEIVPWAASRSVAKWSGERGARALARWRSTAREAAKQSRRTRLPLVTEPATTAQVAARLGAAPLAVVLDAGVRRPLAGLAPAASGEIVVVVGPEGGVSESELQVFTTAGATRCRLGPTVLRSSTAGAAAGVALALLTGRWR
jgi:16S rRNA (uracil1498-N3)-methyltransferase